MVWEVVKLNTTGGRNAPFVSVGRGALDFNKAACDLINDDGKYKFAQLLKAKENGRTVVAVKFLTEYQEESMAIARKKMKGKTVAGMTVRNKSVVEKLFGKDGTNNGVVRHKVEPIGDNMLKIID